MKLSVSWGLGITVVYAAFACATLGVVGFAMTRPVDLVSVDYYARSLQEDARREAAARAMALGPAFRIEVAADRRDLLVSLPAAQAPTATGTITWYRPSDARADRVVPLHVDGEGRQELSLGSLSAGYWILQLEWVADGRPYYDERPVHIP